MLDIDEILQNGKFNSTYKLALLIAICHICELYPISQQSETRMSYEELAEIFIKGY